MNMHQDDDILFERLDKAVLALLRGEIAEANMRANRWEAFARSLTNEIGPELRKNGQKINAVLDRFEAETRKMQESQNTPPNPS